MRAVIFDLDGTMIDNMMVHHRAWHQKLREVGINWSLEQVHQKVHGVNTELLERLWPGRFSFEERLQISAEKEAAYREIYAPDLELVKGLPDLLHHLKRYNVPMGVGSAAPPENVDFVMNVLDLWHYFLAIKHSEDVINGKPHPEVYLKLMEELDVNAKECVVFEDTPAGAEAARRAGCKVIVVTTSHRKEEFASNDKIVKFIQNFTETSVQEILEF